MLRLVTRSQSSLPFCHAIFSRATHSASNRYELKYSGKLQQRAQQQGLSLPELKEKVKAEELERRRDRLASAPAATTQEAAASPKSSPDVSGDSSSVVKPLSSILNLPKVLSATSNQLSSLWTAYHASRSDGTGRGYLCASIPLDIYQKMAEVASKYPTFVLPLLRPAGVNQDESNAADAYEFYYLQWSFHHAPSSPSSGDNARSAPLPISTIHLTPLVEFKLRTSFAMPYLVLTNYTELAHSHGLVLLRGEITTGTAAGSPNYLLRQEDAQALSMGLQKFYLWDQNDGAEKLVRRFHEDPSSFRWEDIVEQSSLLG